MHLHKIPCTKPHWVQTTSPGDCQFTEMEDTLYPWLPTETTMASPASLLSWKKWMENNQHGMPLLCSFCQWCNHQNFSGKTRPCWGFQRRWKVTVVSYIFKKYGLFHWVFFWFVFCDLPWKQFSSLSLSRCLTLSAEKAEKRASCRGSLEMESWQEKPWQYTLNCLKPSAERSRTHCFGYFCHRKETEIEKDLHRNTSLNKLKTKEHHLLNKVTCAHILVNNSLFYSFIGD